MFLTSSRKIELIDPILKTKKNQIIDIHLHVKENEKDLTYQHAKKVYKFDDLKSFQFCPKVLYNTPPPLHTQCHYIFPFCNKLQKEIKNGLRFLSLPTQCSSFRLAALSSRTPSLSGRPRSSCWSPPGIPLGCLCCSPSTHRGIRVTSLATVSC